MSSQFEQVNPVLGEYRNLIVTSALRSRLFWLSQEERDEWERLEAIGPSHGPHYRDVDWRTRRGRITTYYKGRDMGHGRRTD